MTHSHPPERRSVFVLVRRYAVNLWSQARDSVAVGSAVNAIQSLQTKEEAKKEEAKPVLGG